MTTSSGHFEADDLVRKEIPDIPFTYEFVLEKLGEGWPLFQTALQKSKIHNVVVSTIGEGTGFMSTLKKFTVHFADPCMKPMSAVLKTQKNEKFKPMHNIECEFYTEFGGKGIIPLPVIYYAGKWDASSGIEGLLIMENLSGKGQLVSVFDGASIAQVGENK